MAAMRIGLTGGIGSGKSTVAAMLAGHGATVIDTDLIARRITEPGGAAIDAVRTAFGASFIAADGSLDRVRMREAVFADVAARRRLEAILHPIIGAAVEQQAAATDPETAAIVFDIPLLVESGRWRSRVDAVWVVDCSEARQIARVVERSGWTAASVRAVMAQQASRGARRAAADAVVDNDGLSFAALADEVRALWLGAVAAPH
ncbi:MAG: dephospho-CoA kinase [Caldimonas sp.]